MHLISSIRLFRCRLVFEVLGVFKKEIKLVELRTLMTYTIVNID